MVSELPAWTAKMFADRITVIEIDGEPNKSKNQ